MKRKMTYKEALDILINKIQIDVRFVNDDEFKAMEECLYKCKDALEKQLPKKPNANCYPLCIVYRCPVCGKLLTTYYLGTHIFSKDLTKFCPDCGQSVSIVNVKTPKGDQEA